MVVPPVPRRRVRPLPVPLHRRAFVPESMDSVNKEPPGVATSHYLSLRLKPEALLCRIIELSVGVTYLLARDKKFEPGCHPFLPSVVRRMNLAWFFSVCVHLARMLFGKGRHDARMIHEEGGLY